MLPLASPGEALGMQHAVEVGGARHGTAAGSCRERCHEGARIGPPAFEAGTVAGGERGRLVEEEQLGVAAAPHVAVASLELEAAANPGARYPAPPRERAIVAMETAAAIAEEHPAGGLREEIAERIDTVGQRHGAVMRYR